MVGTKTCPSKEGEDVQFNFLEMLYAQHRHMEDHINA